MRHTAFTKYAAIITAFCITLGMVSSCGQSNGSNQTGAYAVTGEAAMQPKEEQTQQSTQTAQMEQTAQNSDAVTLPDTSEARPVVVSGEKTLGDTGKTFVNDYNPSDRSYAASDNYISPKGNRQYGTTTTVEYYSSTLGTTRKADVILPYGYDASKSYPVLYMLHGMGGSNKSWSDMGQLL